VLDIVSSVDKGYNLYTNFNKLYLYAFKSRRLANLNKHFSKLIDNYSLYDLHKRRSTCSQFYKGIVSVPQIEDVDSFYALPSTPNIKFSQKTYINNYSKGVYKYESQVKNNQSSNNYSTGTYYE